MCSQGERLGPSPAASQESLGRMHTGGCAKGAIEGIPNEFLQIWPPGVGAPQNPYGPNIDGIPNEFLQIWPPGVGAPQDPYGPTLMEFLTNSFKCAPKGSG